LSRQSLHPCVRVVGETDGQCGHGSVLGNQRSGRHDAQRREAHLGAFEIPRVVRDDGLRSRSEIGERRNGPDRAGTDSYSANRA
jgi:hypothetical protein